MTRAAGLLFPILTLAAAAPAKDAEVSEKSDPSPPPVVKRLTIPNPLTDPLALGVHLRKKTETPVAELKGVISVRDATGDISFAWDPETCRLAVCWKGGEEFSPESEITYLATGPGPVAASVAAFGSPQFFGYRLIEGGVPEFLYIQGRLGVEESYRIGEGGKSLVQRLRIENADFGALISVPPAWRKKATPSAGDWSGDFLKISAKTAKEGFTLTYDLSTPAELPELPDGWGVSPAGQTPVEEATTDRFGVPAPPLKANPGFTVTPIRIPFPDSADGLADFRLLDDGRMVAVSGSGTFCLGDPESEKSWKVFASQLGTGATLLDAGSMPDSLLAAEPFGITRIFDTDGDGAADFFKTIREMETGKPEPEEETETAEEPKIRGPEFFEPDLRLTGTDPEKPVTLQKGDGGSPAIFESLAWIPRAWCADPSARPAFSPIDETEAGPFSNQIFLSAADPENPLRIIRVVPEWIEGTWQGTAVEMVPGVSSVGTFEPAKPAPGRIRVSPDGQALFVPSREPGQLLRITRNPKAEVFELTGIRLAADGFEFRFSQPIDRKQAVKSDAVSIRKSAPDSLESIAKSEVTLNADRHVVDADARTLTVQLSNVAPGNVYAFDLAELRSEAGESLPQPEVLFSVRAVPAKAVIPSAPAEDPGTEVAPEPDPFAEIDRSETEAKTESDPDPDSETEPPLKEEEKR